MVLLKRFMSAFEHHKQVASFVDVLRLGGAGYSSIVVLVRRDRLSKCHIKITARVPLLSIVGLGYLDVTWSMFL